MEKNENKTNNKKKGILIVALLLALIIAIFAMAGTTFAKYVTSATQETQKATVAKWGYVVSISPDALFASNYEYDSTKKASVASTKTDSTDKTSLTVSASSGNVVAPGTSGSMTFSVKGQAEVLANITVTAKGQDISLTRKESGTSGQSDYKAAINYHPVKWTLKEQKGTAAATPVENVTTLDDVITYLTGKTYGDSKLATKSPILGEKQAKTDVDYTYTLSWAWAYDTDDDKDSSDEYDTILGDYVTADSTTLTTKYGKDYASAYTAVTETEFQLTISVEQAKYPA
jgi:hypothetical protein